jgi:putative transposase
MALIGAERHERSDAGTGERNGHRFWVLTTKTGDVDLVILRLRSENFFFPILEPRRCIDQVLYAVVMEAYVHRVSTRAVDDLVKPWAPKEPFGGASSTTSAFHCICLDATYFHVRNHHQVTSKPVVVATKVTEDGRREIVDVGDSEDEAFRREFLRALKRRGLSGLRLVVSEQHAGLLAASRRCFQGRVTSCRIHFTRNHSAKDAKRWCPLSSGRSLPM